MYSGQFWVWVWKMLGRVLCSQLLLHRHEAKFKVGSDLFPTALFIVLLLSQTRRCGNLSGEPSADYEPTKCDPMAHHNPLGGKSGYWFRLHI